VTDVVLGARVVCLRSLQAPAIDPDAFARAGLELADLALPSGDEQTLSHLVQALASGCTSLVLDLEEREIAERLRKTAGAELPAVYASQATLIHNTALTLSALRARRVDLEAARLAIGGVEATLVGEALQALGVAPEQIQPLAEDLQSLPEVDLILCSDELLAGLPPEPEAEALPEGSPQKPAPATQRLNEPKPPAPPTRLALPIRDPGRVLPALARAATDTGRILDFQGCVAVARALVDLSRGDGSLPEPDDLRLLPTLASVAAEAGRLAGLEEGAEPEAAPEFDPVPYREALEGVQSPLRRSLAGAVERARKSSRRLVILDAEDPEALLAARLLAQQQLAEPLLLGDLFKLETRAHELGFSLRGLDVHNPQRDKLREPYAQALHEVLGEELALDLDEARRWVGDPQVFAALTVARGEAEGVLGLARRDRGLQPLERALAILPQRAKGSGDRKSGLHVIARRDRTFVLSDTLGPRDPTSEEVADAALDAANFVEHILGETPRVAIVAGATYGARSDVALERLRRARDLARVRQPGLIVDGPLRAEVALDGEVQAARYPACALQGEPANVLVVPGRAAARIALDLLTSVAGAESAGPFVWSLRHPLGFAPLGAKAETLVHTALITAALAIQADLQHKGEEASPLREALERAVKLAKEAEEAEEAAAAAEGEVDPEAEAKAEALLPAAVAAHAEGSEEAEEAPTETGSAEELPEPAQGSADPLADESANALAGDSAQDDADPAEEEGADSEEASEQEAGADAPDEDPASPDDVPDPGASEAPPEAGAAPARRGPTPEERARQQEQLRRARAQRAAQGKRPQQQRPGPGRQQQPKSKAEAEALARRRAARRAREEAAAKRPKGPPA